MIHVCKIAVTPGGRIAHEKFMKLAECGEPATHCIVCHDSKYSSGDSESPVTVWLCEDHYNNPMLRQFYESVWAEVDY